MPVGIRETKIVGEPRDLVALFIAAPVGLSLLNASATQQEIAEQQVRDAVQPGEDPDHGPAGMRKAGADMGAAVSSVFSILFVVVLPPVQLAAVLIPAVIAFGVSAYSQGTLCARLFFLDGRLCPPDTRRLEKAPGFAVRRGAGECPAPAWFAGS
jgi:multisubunit Na+/H+ antiporter MnhG subunit